ncbi:MAG: HYR domain-containing protein [Saprospirales bacterium]|nr:HYR domain-containing protein [Saprospirales bacterium]
MPEPVCATPSSNSGAVGNGNAAEGIIYALAVPANGIPYTNIDWTITGGDIVGGGDNTMFVEVVWGAGPNGTIAVTVTDANGCSAMMTPVNVTIYAAPEASSVMLMACPQFPGSFFADFTLADAEDPDGVQNASGWDVDGDGLPGVSGGVTVSYHLSQFDADNDLNPITDEPFNSNSKTIYVRLESSDGCVQVRAIWLTVKDTPLAPTTEAYTVCADEPLMELPLGEGLTAECYQEGGLLDVLVLSWSYYTYRTADVQAKLATDPRFATVDALHQVVPTLAQLQQYDVVLVFTDDQPPVSLGNVLGAYADAGGAVVDAVFSRLSGGTWGIPGAWQTSGYPLVNLGNQEHAGASGLGTVHLPGHPVMQGVATFIGGWRTTGNVLSLGSYRIADWTGGLPLVVANNGVGPANVRRVYLNFFPPSSDVDGAFGWISSTDGALLMANALVWAAGQNAGGNSCDEITWWDAQYGGNLVGTGEVFDPIEAGEVDPSAAGEYTFWAQCNCPCPSLRTPATFEVIDVILSPLADIGPVCPDGEVGDILLSAQPFDPNIVYSWTGGALAGLPDGNSTGLNPHIPGFTAGGNEGVWTVTVTATLGACTDVTTFDISIDDVNGLHWVNCPADIIVGNDVDECGAYVNWTPPVGIDDCVLPNDVIVTPTVGLQPGSLFSVAGSPHTIEYEAEDGNGGLITCSFTVTVLDTQNPNAVCQDFTVSLDENGEATITAAQVDGGSYDNCDVDLDFAVDFEDIFCEHVGENFVTLTVTDDNGNFDICVATITVVDDIAPTIECPEDITVSNDPGICGAEVEFELPVIDDNCDLPSGGANPVIFNNTGSVQTWMVPPGVTSILVDVLGAEGGGGTDGNGRTTSGGLGGRVQAELSVTPGDVLNLYVGGAGFLGCHSWL